MTDSTTTALLLASATCLSLLVIAAVSMLYHISNLRLVQESQHQILAALLAATKDNQTNARETQLEFGRTLGLLQLSAERLDAISTHIAAYVGTRGPASRELGGVESLDGEPALAPNVDQGASASTAEDRADPAGWNPEDITRKYHRRAKT